MQNLKNIWLYVLRFVTCIKQVSVDAFSLLYSKLLLAELSQFVFGSTFVESHWQFFSIRSCFVRD